MSEGRLVAIRGPLVDFVDDPGGSMSDECPTLRWEPDGLLFIRDGRIVDRGPARALLGELPSHCPVLDYRAFIVMPGFVDLHVHYPQLDVIASPGRNLLDWLERYTFPAERRFSEPAHCLETAEDFLDELLAHGTTTALVFGTVHRQSVDAFFEIARSRRLRMIAGKVLMDRNCPEDLRDSPEQAYQDSRELIERWHGLERLGYAITPRFAITSSEAQLEAAGRLAREFPTAWIHSHLSENVDEIEWVGRLFPRSKSYLDVYDSFGLVRERAIYAHCIWLDHVDRVRMASQGATAAFCPTSNLFLGSGLFDLAATDQAGLRFGIATDVGGGTSFSMLRTLAEAWKVAQLRGQTLSPLRAFYLATLGGARALGLDERIGSFEPGREADLVVLDPAATPLAARRDSQCRTLTERLFALMMLGDDRSVAQTWILGEPWGGRRSERSAPAPRTELSRDPAVGRPDPGR
jgi:guanine deaminase